MRTRSSQGNSPSTRSKSKNSIRKDMKPLTPPSGYTLRSRTISNGPEDEAVRSVASAQSDPHAISKTICPVDSRTNTSAGERILRSRTVHKEMADNSGSDDPDLLQVIEPASLAHADVEEEAPALHSDDTLAPFSPNATKTTAMVSSKYLAPRMKKNKDEDGQSEERCVDNGATIPTYKAFDKSAHPVFFPRAIKIKKEDKRKRQFKNFSEEEIACFEDGYIQLNKDLVSINNRFLPHRTLGEVMCFFLNWKVKIGMKLYDAFRIQTREKEHKRTVEKAKRDVENNEVSGRGKRRCVVLAERKVHQAEKNTKVVPTGAAAQEKNTKKRRKAAVGTAVSTDEDKENCKKRGRGNSLNKSFLLPLIPLSPSTFSLPPEWNRPLLRSRK